MAIDNWSYNKIKNYLDYSTQLGGGKDYSMMSSIWASSDVENTAPKRLMDGGVTA